MAVKANDPALRFMMYCSFPHLTRKIYAFTTAYSLDSIYFHISAIIGQIKGELIFKTVKTAQLVVHKHFEIITTSIRPPLRTKAATLIQSTKTVQKSWHS